MCSCSAQFGSIVIQMHMSLQSITSARISDTSTFTGKVCLNAMGGPVHTKSSRRYVRASTLQLVASVMNCQRLVVERQSLSALKRILRNVLAQYALIRHSSQRLPWRFDRFFQAPEGSSSAVRRLCLKLESCFTTDVVVHIFVPCHSSSL